MDQNMWAHLVDLPVRSHPESMDYDVYSDYNLQAGFSTHEPSQLLDTLPAFPFTAQELPVGGENWIID